MRSRMSASVSGIILERRGVCEKDLACEREGCGRKNGDDDDDGEEENDD